jgi:hypothetical protein
LTEKLIKVENVDISSTVTGEAKPTSIFRIFRPGRPGIQWQKYDMNCHQGRRQDIFQD